MIADTSRQYGTFAQKARDFGRQEQSDRYWGFRLSFSMAEATRRQTPVNSEAGVGGNREPTLLLPAGASLGGESCDERSRCHSGCRCSTRRGTPR